MRRFRECIASARRALALRPSYAEALNNIAAAHNALGEWDAGIAAGEEALRLNPSLQIARNNVTLRAPAKPDRNDVAIRRAAPRSSSRRTSRRPPSPTSSPI